MTGVVTYGADELAFTEEELEELGEVTGIDGLEAGNMIQATGGWPALVRLMCQTPNPDLPPASWPETRSYFRDNLLSVLPDNARRFVCNAAMLEEISAECYDYVYKTQQADQEISFLNEKFALLAPTASSGKRLTMHPVLREYLRSVFSATQRERRSYVLKRVAFWHWRRGSTSIQSTSPWKPVTIAGRAWSVTALFWTWRSGKVKSKCFAHGLKRCRPAR